MRLKLIHSEADYQATLNRIRALWEAEPNTAEADELEILAMIVNKYEEDHFPIEEPDPIDYIKVRMEELGLSQEDENSDPYEELREALVATNKAAQEAGLDKMTLEEIDAEIAAIRNGD